MAWSKTYTGEEPMRINKWLALEGVCSRREADALIEKGMVRLNGETLRVQGEKIEAGQTLSLEDSATRRLDNQLTIILNKPVGYVSGTPEGDEVPAVRLVREGNLSGRAHAIPGRNNKLAPLGRLDKDSRGLLILSEDGVLAKALIGPESDIEKEYVVKVKGRVSPEKLALLRHGLELDGRQLRPAIVEIIEGNILRFVLKEGRNRQIRRMCDLVDLTVKDLERVRIGAVALAGLREGMWRPMSGKEKAMLLRADTFKPRPARAPRPKPSEFEGDPRANKPRPSKGQAPARKGPPRESHDDQDGFGKPVEHRRASERTTRLKRTKLGPRKRTPIK